jgi:hypothetical protein
MRIIKGLPEFCTEKAMRMADGSFDTVVSVSGGTMQAITGFARPKVVSINIKPSYLVQARRVHSGPTLASRRQGRWMTQFTA